MRKINIEILKAWRNDQPGIKTAAEPTTTGLNSKQRGTLKWIAKGGKK